MSSIRASAAILAVLTCSNVFGFSDERPQDTDKPAQEVPGNNPPGNKIQIIINGRVVNGGVIRRPIIAPPQKPLELKIKEKLMFPAAKTAGKVSQVVEKDGLSLTIQPEKKDFAKTDNVIAFKVTLKNTSDKVISLYGENQLGVKPTLEIQNMDEKGSFKVIGQEKIPAKNLAWLRLKPNEEFTRTVFVDTNRRVFGNKKIMPAPMAPRPIRGRVSQPVPGLRPGNKNQPGANGGGNPGIGGGVKVVQTVQVQAVSKEEEKKKEAENNKPQRKLPMPPPPPLNGNNVQRFQLQIAPGNPGRPVLRPAFQLKKRFERGAYKATLTLEFTKAPFSDKPNKSEWAGKITSKPVVFEIE